MGQNMSDSNVALAFLGKSGPIFGNRVVPPKLPPFPKNVDTGGGQGFGGGIQDEHGVAGHGEARISVGLAAKEIQHGFAMPVHRQRRARMDPLLDLLLEQGFHPIQTLGVHLDSVSGDYHSLPPSYIAVGCLLLTGVPNGR